MKPEDLVGLAAMVLTMVLVLGSLVRASRRLSRARPELTGPPRRIVLPPPASRAVAPGIVPPKRSTAPPKRRPAPSLEARVLGNRRLSAGARLIVASEILSRPKALRPRRPL